MVVTHPQTGSPGCQGAAGPGRIRSLSRSFIRRGLYAYQVQSIKIWILILCL